MRITFVYRYFAPDTAPFGLLLAEMIPALVAAGYDVDVIAGYPAYGEGSTALRPPKRENLYGANVRRMSLPPVRKLPGGTFIDATLFCLGAAFKILLGRQRDVCWIGSTPPVIQPWLVGLAARIRSTKIIYQIQDIHPEIGLHSGKMKPGLFTWLLTFLDNSALRRADRVTVLSDDMADVIENRSGIRPEVLNNFALGLPEVSSVPRTTLYDGPVRFAYAGNIGQFQNLDRIVDAFADVPPDLAELHLLGDGKAKANLVDTVKSRKITNIYFYDRCSATEAFAFLCRQDVGVISLEPGLYRLAYPTKLHSYFAAGLKVFALLEEESRLARLIHTHNAGDVIAVDRPRTAVSERIMSLARTLRDQENSLSCVPRTLWHRDAAMARWFTLLDGLQKTDTCKAKS